MLNPARIAGAAPPYFNFIQNAYNAALHADTIQSQSYVFNENLVFDKNISVTLESGYDCDYTDNSGTTIIIGDVIISDGVLTLASGTLEIL